MNTSMWYGGSYAHFGSAETLPIMVLMVLIMAVGAVAMWYLFRPDGDKKEK